MKRFAVVLTVFVMSCTQQKVVEVPAEIEDLFLRYVAAWSDGDVDEIVGHVYGVPSVFYRADNVVVLNSKDQVREFLTSTFKALDKNDYDYSTFNGWGHLRNSEGNVVVEMNYTRYLKDGAVMGAKERTATYVVRRDTNNAHKIFAVIPHTPLTE